MAAKKGTTSPTHSQINAGDFVYDFHCTPCDKKNLNKEAYKYCEQCGEYFCKPCVNNHKSFKALSSHILTDPKDIRPVFSRSGKRLHQGPTEICTKHNLKIVDMYCEGHNVVGCCVCFLQEHRSCTDIHYVPEYLQSGCQTNQVNKINKKLTQAIKVTKDVKTKGERRKENLDESKTICKQEIDKYRNEINQIIDKIEKNTLEELDARYKEMRKGIDNRNVNIDNVHSDMVRLKSEIESSQSNDSQKFVCAKLGECLIKQGDTIASETQTKQNVEVKFTRNTDIITYLLSLVTLGILSSPDTSDSNSSSSKPPQQTQPTPSKPPRQTQPTPSKPPQQTQPKPSQSASGHNRKNKQPTTSHGTAGSMKAWKQGLYSKVDSSEYNIKQSDDKYDCGIWSSCIVGNNILLADYNNDKIKLVNSKKYTIISSLGLNATPRSVCSISCTEAAVCLGNCSIQFMSIHGDKLVVTRTLSMNHACRCMSISSDHMYVCDDGSTIYVYTLNGKQLVKSISVDQSGDRIFSDIWDITISDDERRLHVADGYKGLITLSIEGEVLWRYTDTYLKIARGVCTDGEGDVIVCGWNSNNVLQLSSSGEYKGEILTSHDGLCRPQPVTFDRNKQTLIVGQYRNNTIKVFTVK